MNKESIKHFVNNNAGVFSNFANLGFIQVSNILIQLVLFPIIIRLVGLESFGYVAIANAIAGFMGLFINYGTGLSGIKAVAIEKDNQKKLALLFFNIYYTRFVLFAVTIIVPILLYFLHYKQLNYLLFATPIILAEIVNPLFFFNGIEKLTIYNSANFLAKLSTALLIFLMINSNTPAWMVNFYLGLGNLFFYSCLVIYVIQKYQFSIPVFRVASFMQIVKSNFYLVSNNLAVHLQQSFFLFLLPTVSTPIVVGAYSLADKVVSSIRLLLVAFSSALYPKAAISFQLQHTDWPYYKKKMNRFLFFAFLIASFCLYWGNEWIVLLLTGNQNPLSATYVRSIALVPLLAAMNTLNIIELLIKNQYNSIFYSSLSLMVFVFIVSIIFIIINKSDFFGYYLVLAEAAAIPITLYFIRRNITSQPKN